LVFPRPGADYVAPGKNRCVFEAKEYLTPHINLKDLRASITQVCEELSEDYIVKT
jgi:hypothetical protein